MSDIRKLPATDVRVETGPIQFGDDWPGTFIRGDNAAYYAAHLKRLIDGSVDYRDEISISVLRGLLSDLRSSRVP